MSMRKMVRKLLSLSTAEGYWKSEAARRTPGVKLGSESLEDRTVPSFTATNAGGVVTIAITDNATQVKLTPNGANLEFRDEGNNNKLTVAQNAITRITTDNSATNKSIAVFKGTADLGGLTALKQVDFKGGTANENIDLTNFTTANTYHKFDLGSGTDSFVAPGAGVSVLQVGADLGAQATWSYNTGPANGTSKQALSFKGMTTGVQVNLNSQINGALATGTKLQITLTGNTSDSNKIIGVYGSKGADSLIGNDQDNILIGFEGDDTIIGAGGNDQLNANRDFSPSMPGATNTGGIAVSDANTVYDITQFTTLATTFAAIPGTPATAAALFTKFGFFSFGEGVAALNGAGSLNATATAADFATANGITSTASADQLFGGAGNDGLYGFNGVSMTASGQAGNDVFSTNTKGGPGLYDGGDGDDFLIGSPGVTLLGGAGNDELSYAVADPNATQTLLTYGVGGTGNDKITAGLKNVTIDASEGTDTVAIANDATDVLIFNGTTSITGGVGSIGAVKKAQR